jgi:hypothetical protein
MILKKLKPTTNIQDCSKSLLEWLEMSADEARKRKTRQSTPDAR